jgi:hypothetical protein
MRLDQGKDQWRIHLDQDRDKWRIHLDQDKVGGGSSGTRQQNFNGWFLGTWYSTCRFYKMRWLYVHGQQLDFQEGLCQME